MGEQNIDTEVEEKAKSTDITTTSGKQESESEIEDIEFLDDVRKPVEARSKDPIAESGSMGKKGKKNTQKQRKLERKRVLAVEGSTEDDLRAPKRPQNYYDKVNVKNKSNWTKR